MKRISLILLAALSGCVKTASFKSLFTDDGVLERVGILAHVDITWENSTAPLLSALSHFRAVKADKIVFIGDPSRDGYSDQKRIFAAAWEKAFAGVQMPEMEISADPFLYAGISFTADKRLALTDLLCVHPADGKRINVGSMRGIEISGLFEKFSARDLGRIRRSAQGVLVLRRRDSLEVKRLDFSGRRTREVGPPWVVGQDGRIISEARGVPEFWKDTSVKVLPGYAADATKILTIRWPSVLARYTGARAFSYDVEISSPGAEERLYRVQSAAFHLPEEDDSGAVSLSVAAEGLPEATVSITPISSLGLRGKSVKTFFSQKGNR